MALIDNTYFVRDINLVSGQLTNITSWINESQEVILTKLLGTDLYDELIADLVNDVPQTQKFIDLVDGKTFEFETTLGGSVKAKYKGLKPIIAYYTYYYFRNHTETKVTVQGQKKNKAEISETVPVLPNLMYSFNKVVDLYGETPKYATKEYMLNRDVYKHWDNRPSAFNYLLANKTDFENWVFEPIKKLNYFLL